MTTLSPSVLIDPDHASALLAPLTDLALRAAMAILAIDRSSMTVEGKADGSPVTAADLAADRVITQGLALIAPAIAVVSEEQADNARPPYRDSFILVDPLDGTREYVAGRDEFTVNIAIVTQGQPVLGIVGAPALGVMWRGVVGRGAEKLTFDANGRISSLAPIQTRPLPANGAPWVAAVSRSHGDAQTEAFIAGRAPSIRQEVGSAVKFGHIAEGAADIYPRLSTTCEWDVAAGHAVVSAAGGIVTDRHGAPLRFGGLHKGFLLPEFIVWGDPAAVRTCAPSLG